MKGLLYKEFYLGRKNYLAFLALTFVFSLLGALVCLSMICGNLQSIPVEEPDTVEQFTILFTYVLYVLGMFAVFGSNQSVYGDYASGFMKYSYTLPVKAVKAVGARYLTGLIVLGIGILCGIANALIISTLTGRMFTLDILKNMMMILGVIVLVYSAGVPLALKFKTAKTVSGITVLAVAVMYLVAGAFLISGMSRFEATVGAEAGALYMEMIRDKYSWIRNTLLPFFPVILFAMLGISFLASVKIYQRREK